MALQLNRDILGVMDLWHKSKMKILKKHSKYKRPHFCFFFFGSNDKKIYELDLIKERYIIGAS